MLLARLVRMMVALRLACAHTIFIQIDDHPIGYAIRETTSDYPLFDLTSNDIACNGGSNTITPSSHVLDVKAGEEVEMTWRHTQNAPLSDPAYVVDPSHKGPVIAYMKKVGDATQDVGFGPGWFKISEAGYDDSTKKWAVDDLIAARGIQKTRIPSCIAPGQYLLRAEVIALHQAETVGGAQFFTECAQINVVGGTGAKAPHTVSFPGAYSPEDPGILVNIYWPVVTNYTIPGPPVFTC